MVDTTMVVQPLVVRLTIILAIFSDASGRARALPTRHYEVPGSNPAGGGIQLDDFGALLHRAFHYHPSIVSI